MTVLELVVAGIMALLGVRSLITWLRKDFQPTSFRERLLYVLHVFSRVGMWFAFAAFFFGYATVEEPSRLRWFLFLVVGLAGIQLLTGLALARSPGSGPPDEPPT